MHFPESAQQAPWQSGSAVGDVYGYAHSQDQFAASSLDEQPHSYADAGASGVTVQVREGEEE